MGVSMDYYKILAVKRDASTEEVKKQYRKLALKWHPDRSPANREECEKKFRDIAESYDVLSEPAKRAIFDQYGEAGLKDGIPDGAGGLKGGFYRFSGDPQDIFEHFFGTSSPFADIFGEMEDEEAPEFFGEMTGMSKPVEPTQSPPIEREFQCSLQELYNGCTKKVTISKKVLNPDGQTTHVEDKQLMIEVKPGWTNGTRVKFPKAGDEGQGIIPADIVFVLKETPYGSYDRIGHDLIYTADITLEDALCGCVVQIKTMDGRKLAIPVTEVVHTNYTKMVTGEGMPVLQAAGEQGNLTLKFNIIFPTTLKEVQKSALRKVLRQSS